MELREKISQRTQDLKGKAKEAAGRLSDDSRLRASGRSDQRMASLRHVGERAKGLFRK